MPKPHNDTPALAHALELVMAAESDLGPLSDAERRDLLADNTPWPSEYIAQVVAELAQPIAARIEAVQAEPALILDDGDLMMLSAVLMVAIRNRILNADELRELHKRIADEMIRRATRNAGIEALRRSATP